jgi:hypothetical protein
MASAEATVTAQPQPLYDDVTPALVVCGRRDLVRRLEEHRPRAREEPPWRPYAARHRRRGLPTSAAAVAGESSRMLPQGLPHRQVRSPAVALDWPTDVPRGCRRGPTSSGPRSPGLLRARPSMTLNIDAAKVSPRRPRVLLALEEAAVQPRDVDHRIARTGGRAVMGVVVVPERDRRVAPRPRRPAGSSRHVGWAELLKGRSGVWGGVPDVRGGDELRAVAWSPATLDVLASLRRSARGPPPGNAASGA